MVLPDNDEEFIMSLVLERTEADAVSAEAVTEAIIACLVDKSRASGSRAHADSSQPGTHAYEGPKHGPRLG